MYLRVLRTEANQSEGVYLKCAKYKGGRKGVFLGVRELTEECTT